MRMVFIEFATREQICAQCPEVPRAGTIEECHPPARRRGRPVRADVIIPTAAAYGRKENLRCGDDARQRRQQVVQLAIYRRPPLLRILRPAEVETDSEDALGLEPGFRGQQITKAPNE